VTAGRLSIVVPIYNEHARLERSLSALAAFCDRRGAADVVVVNDGSTDDSVAIATRFARQDARIRVIDEDGHQGKGATVRRGMLAATGDWILFTDADLSTPLEEVDTLLRAADQHAAVGAIGSRGVDRSLVGVHQAKAREWSGRFFNVVMRAMVGLSFRDTQCGFKLYRRDAAGAIFSRQRLPGFAFDVEDLFIAARLNLRIVEVPVRWNDAGASSVTLASGARAFTDLLRIRWHALRGDYR
jgi:glycosyltransferase involved in cell wall biosynthesis